MSTRTRTRTPTRTQTRTSTRTQTPMPTPQVEAELAELDKQIGAAQKELAKQTLSSDGGFQLIFKDRYLLLIAALILVLNIVNSTGEFLLGKVVVAEANKVVGAAPELEDARA